jgi:GNAT superfamily N-acetyltransferase
LQHQGYGSALLRHALERCDRDGFPAYLESTNLRNLPLYERFGFLPMGRIQTDTSPVITPMLRRPR